MIRRDLLDLACESAPRVRIGRIEKPVDLTIPRKLAERFEPVGSRVTCNPPPTDTDEDWLMLVDRELDGAILDRLMALGWTWGGSQIPVEASTVPVEDRFVSFTKGEKNLIVTSSRKFFDRFMTATAIAKERNILDKAERVALFNGMLYQ